MRGKNDGGGLGPSPIVFGADDPRLAPCYNSKTTYGRLGGTRHGPRAPLLPALSAASSNPGSADLDAAILRFDRLRPPVRPGHGNAEGRESDRRDRRLQGG